ncbi:NAC domain-containing protein 72-like [Oryza brachyantha]|uniref:NAC domain-containing protein 72-like n=1 Tax=Oryza brachyantha TaxID=4533 RepID=UPI001AD99CA3|nr:NAC domain-containing protein 72-like [Oryza brachyantha]
MAAPEDGEDGKRKWANKHGIARGFHFVPDDLDLLDILDDKLRGLLTDPAHDAVFHDVRILDFHPATLYEMYAEDEVDGCIYFFSRREFRRAKKKKTMRAAKYGQWKVFGSCKTIGAVAVGRRYTLEFYERRFDSSNNHSVRTNWCMHEFLRIIGPENEVSGLAVYRLYNKMATTIGEEKAEDNPVDCAKNMNHHGQASAAGMAVPPCELGRWYAYGYEYQPPPMDSAAASTLGHKGKRKSEASASMTSTDHARSTNTSAPPSADYQPPPPPPSLQGTENISGSGDVVGHEDDWEQVSVAEADNAGAARG